MLVLSRRESEQILIGEGIVVTVSRVWGRRVQLAIHAPQGVRILRGELKPLETTAAANTPPTSFETSESPTRLMPREQTND